MDGATLWATTSDPAHAVAGHPKFGDAAATYNVIDVRQSYLQKLLKQALSAIGHPQEADRLTHFSYEMVALSHATAKELGFAPDPDSEDAKKPFVEVSGRRGLGVKADDLIDRVIEKALVEAEPFVQLLENVVGPNHGILQVRTAFTFETERLVDVECDHLGARVFDQEVADRGDADLFGDLASLGGGQLALAPIHFDQRLLDHAID